MKTPVSTSREWLEADGLGGFASGTIAGIRTRRYHALLLSGNNGPTGRFALVNGFDAEVDIPAGTVALSSQSYLPGVVSPNGRERIVEFANEPWPRWVFDLGNGVRIQQEIFVPKGEQLTVLTWRSVGSTTPATLRIRPFLSGRDYHSLQHENGAFRFDAAADGEKITWRPYDGVPAIIALANASYAADAHWYRNFNYEEERARGLDHAEDLATPGVFTWDLAEGEAVWIIAHQAAVQRFHAGASAVAIAAELRTAELERRRLFKSPLHRAADAYLVRRGTEQTIIAGYPWFTDWGRDTFIALRGLCLATGRLEDARGILLTWAGAISEGMLPNRFPDHGEQPEFNSVDASLWFVVAIHDYLAAAARDNLRVASAEREYLQRAIETILEGFSSGTRHRIHVDADGLLSSGEPGVQLTWMDAKVGDWVVTPRIGKPVEIQALWLNALWIASQFSPRWQGVLERGRAAFTERFWNAARGALYDVVDVDHQYGRVDPSLRPNQIFAIGGLPLALIEGEKARLILESVEDHLLTPLGLRSLSPEDPAYRPRYEGGVWERDGSYHQGTVWPWLIGPFVEAWVRIHGATTEAKREARERFIAPLLDHLDDAGLGHISEITDAEAPHAPRGCPWQAWSVGELLRLTESVLAEPKSQKGPRPAVLATV